MVNLQYFLSVSGVTVALISGAASASDRVVRRNWLSERATAVVPATTWTWPWRVPDTSADHRP